jgi:hypothetical protein
LRLLLVEPRFPVPSKSKNHAHFLPIGLLKIGSYHKALGDKVKLVRGNLGKKEISFVPDVIMVTSLFTYWSKYVVETVQHYRALYPKAKIIVGGIFASLLPEKCKQLTGCDEVQVGLYKNGAAEKGDIDYSLLPEELDYQIVHASRGCPRHCSFCGVWKIEPKPVWEKSIVDKIRKPKLVFYDNNLLANPNVENLLEETASFRFPKDSPYRSRQVCCESQSGFDGRILEKKPYLASLLKKARFQNPRIAWDGPVSGHKRIRAQLEVLRSAGFNSNELFIFVLYNHDVPYGEMRRKLDFCRRWGVRVIDCRFRPLDSLHDNYKPQAKEQASIDYYIHPDWTDRQVRAFRRAVRRQNIAILLGLPNNRYVEGVERRYVKI